MIVTGIFIYPVKALRAFACDSAVVTPRGLEGDRGWLVINQEGKFITQRQIPALARISAAVLPGRLQLCDAQGHTITIAYPHANAARRVVTIWRDQIEASAADTNADDFISAATGVACHLVYLPAGSLRPVDPRFGQPDDHVNFADAYPLLLCNESSLQDLNNRLKNPVPMSRFRPNLVINGAAPWAEDDWRIVKIGDLILEVVKPCDRCQVTTIDQQSGVQPDGSEPLRTLATFRRDAQNHVIFGQNAIGRKLGLIRLGDQVQVLEHKKGPLF